MKPIFALVVVVGGGLLQAPGVEAVTIDFVPSSQTVALGDPVSVDVVVSGLDVSGEIIRAFDLDATYDPSILSATDVLIDTSLGGLLDSFGGFDLSTPGVVDFFEVSLLSDSELEAIQGDSFTLATLLFDSIAAGTSPLGLVAEGGFNVVVGSDWTELTVQTGIGAVTVQDDGGGTVPEPSTGLLLVVALAVLATRRKLEN